MIKNGLMDLCISTELALFALPPRSWAGKQLLRRAEDAMLKFENDTCVRILVLHDLAATCFSQMPLPWKA
jgi:hypothetical protein